MNGMPNEQHTYKIKIKTKTKNYLSIHEINCIKRKNGKIQQKVTKCRMKFVRSSSVVCCLVGENKQFPKHTRNYGQIYPHCKNKKNI